MTLFDDPLPGRRRSILAWGEERCPAIAGVRHLPADLPLGQAPAPAQVLIAPATLLESVENRAWRPASALVILTGPGRGYVSVQELDRLWRLFRVPCFERLLNADGVVAASECEAHDGLHVAEYPPICDVNGDILYRDGQPVARVAQWRQETCACGVHCRKVYNAAPVIERRAA